MGIFASKMESPDRTKAWMHFDHILADYELRSFRAYLINYEEAHSFDNWAMRWYRQLMWVGVAGIGVQAASFALTGKYKAYRDKVGISGLTAAGISILAHSLETSALPPSLSPFYEGRSQKHVEAGSAWLNINKTARVHRLQLRFMPKETFSESQAEVVSKWCTSLSKSYREASQITAIRQEIYAKYDSYELLQKKMKERQELLQQFLSDTAHNNVDHDETK